MRIIFSALMLVTVMTVTVTYAGTNVRDYEQRVNDYLQAVEKAKSKVGKFKEAIKSGDPVRIKKETLKIQEDPVAIKELNKESNFVKNKFVKTTDSIQAETIENIKQRVARKYNVKPEDVKIKKFTNPSDKIKAGHDWDVTVSIEGKDIDYKNVKEIVHESYFEAAGGEKTYPHSDATTFAEEHHVEVTSEHHGEAYEGGKKYVDNPEEYDVKDAERLSKTIEHKSDLDKNNAEEYAEHGEYGKSEVYKHEQARQYTKQYDKHIKSRIKNMHGKVAKTVQKGTKILKKIGKYDSKLKRVYTPADADVDLAKIGEHGETVESIIKKGSALVESAQKIKTSSKVAQLKEKLKNAKKAVESAEKSADPKKLRKAKKSMKRIQKQLKNEVKSNESTDIKPEKISKRGSTKEGGTTKETSTKPSETIKGKIGKNVGEYMEGALIMGQAQKAREGIKEGDSEKTKSAFLGEDTAKRTEGGKRYNSDMDKYESAKQEEVLSVLTAKLKRMGATKKETESFRKNFGKDSQKIANIIEAVKARGGKDTSPHRPLSADGKMDDKMSVSAKVIEAAKQTGSYGKVILDMMSMGGVTHGDESKSDLSDINKQSDRVFTETENRVIGKLYTELRDRGASREEAREALKNYRKDKSKVRKLVAVLKERDPQKAKGSGGDREGLSVDNVDIKKDDDGWLRRIEETFEKAVDSTKKMLYDEPKKLVVGTVKDLSGEGGSKYNSDMDKYDSAKQEEVMSVLTSKLRRMGATREEIESFRDNYENNKSKTRKIIKDVKSRGGKDTAMQKPLDADGKMDDEEKSEIEKYAEEKLIELREQHNRKKEKLLELGAKESEAEEALAGKAGSVGKLIKALKKKRQEEKEKSAKKEELAKKAKELMAQTEKEKSEKAEDGSEDQETESNDQDDSAKPNLTKLAQQKWDWFKKDVPPYLNKLFAKSEGEYGILERKVHQIIAEKKGTQEEADKCLVDAKKEAKALRRLIGNAKKEHPKVSRKMHDDQGNPIKVLDHIKAFVNKYKIPNNLIVSVEYSSPCLDLSDENATKELKVSISGSKSYSIKSTERVTLNAVISGGKAPVQIHWDGGNISPSGATAIFAATTPGSYTVQVTAKDVDGQSKSDSVTIVVKKIDMPKLSGLPNEVYYGTSKVISVEGIENNAPREQAGDKVDHTDPDDPFSVSTSTNGEKKPCKNPFDKDCNVKISQDSDGSHAGVIMAPADDTEDFGTQKVVKEKEEEKEQEEEQGEYEYVWQPAGGSGLQFDPPSGKNLSVNVTFGNIGDVEIWAEVHKDGKFIGKTEPIKTKIIPPKFSLSVEPKTLYIGDEAKAVISLEPNIDDKFTDFDWLPMGDNAQKLIESQNSRSTTLKVKNIKPTTIEVLAKAKSPYYGDELGRVKYVISAKPYKVSMSKPKRLGKAPWIWDPIKGRAVDQPLAIAVFQNAEVHATITPQPKGKVSYQWSVTPDGCSISAPMSKSTNLNAHKVGTYNVAVKITGENDVLLGKDSGTFTATISQHDLDVAKQKAKDQQKSKDLLQEGRQLWKEGKLDQAIAKVAQAQQLIPKDQEVAKTLKAMQQQKKAVDTKLSEASDLIKRDKLDDASKALTRAATINDKYPKYLELLKQLTDAKKKAQEQKNLLAKLLKDAKTLQSTGKLNEAVTILQNGTKKLPKNEEIKKLLQEIQKQQNDALKKMTDGQTQWKNGLLESAITILQEASKTDPSNKKIAKVLENMQSQKKILDDTLSKVEQSIEQKEFMQAKSLLGKAGHISKNYPPYVAMVKKLASAEHDATIVAEAEKKRQEEEKVKKEKEFEKRRRAEQIKKLLNDAKSKWQQKDKNGAIAKLNEILQIDPNNQEAITQKQEWQNIVEETKDPEPIIAIETSKETKPIHQELEAFSGILTNESPKSSHTVTMPSDGTLNITITTGPELNFYGGIQLKDFDNKTSISRDIHQGPNETKTWSFSFLRAGTYHLNLAKDSRRFYHGPYKITTSIDRQAFSNDKESNDNFETANSLALNQTVGGHLGARGQQRATDQADYWKLTIRNDGELHLDVTTSKELNLYGGVFVYSSNKETRLYGDRHDPSTHRVHTIKKIKAGTYYIKIEKDGRRFYWGSYQLKATLSAVRGYTKHESASTISWVL